MDRGDPKVPPFVEGEQLNRADFHIRYLFTPEKYHAELINGVVHLCKPKTIGHGRTISVLNGVLSEYEEQTPGIEVLLRVTVLLDDQSEPQPDVCLLIPAERGGQTRDEDDLVVGPPELVIEIADTNEEVVDLVAKRLAYQRGGVLEYLVVLPEQQRAIGYVRERDSFIEQRLSQESVWRSQPFPGLWLDLGALLAQDRQRLRSVLAMGIATPEHAAFVARLRAFSDARSS